MSVGWPGVFLPGSFLIKFLSSAGLTDSKRKTAIVECLLLKSITRRYTVENEFAITDSVLAIRVQILDLCDLLFTYL